MLKKKIRRPLRIFTKADIPYIIYKDKKYNIKSTEIKDIIKFINKLQKKTTKKIQTENKPKKDIKKYINEKIKLEGGPTNVPSTQNVQNIEKDTFKINELNNKIEKKKQEIKAIEEEKKKDIKIINNIKAIEEQKIDELIKFDKSTNKYNLITNKLLIEGDSIDDVKNKLDEGYVKLDNDINDLQIKQNELYENIKNIEEEKQNLNIDKGRLKFTIDNKQKSLSSIFDYIKSKNLIDTINNKFNKKIDDKTTITKFNSEFNQNTEIRTELLNFIYDHKNNIGAGKNNNNFGLWNYQIDHIMSPFRLYIKAITLDDLDDMIKYIYNNKILIGSFILNIGNHWTAIYYDFTNEFVLEYYDPFGEPPKSIIIKSFKDLILKFNIEVFVKFKINRVQQQNVKTSNCGWFAMYFLIMRYNNYTFKYITKFKSIKQEEQNIEQLKDKYDKFGFL